jgi:hypothetical protein
MKLRNLLVYVFCVMAGALSATAASAERRVALVIGNSSYKNAPQLHNTISDSTAIGNLFKSVGFEVVISRTDLGVVDFKRAVRDFLVTAETADIAVVYYAGHGVEIGGTNYLVPIDAKLGRDYDVEDEAIALDRIIWALEPVRRLRLILLDACRNNPFPMKIRSAGVRSTMQGGLGKIEDVSADTLVAYAAKAGSVSYDGDGNNSPYATALLKHLGEPGVDIRIALGRVRDDVIGMTGGRQEPFIYGSLGGSTMALVPASAPAPTPKQVEPPPVPQQVAKPAVAPAPSVPPMLAAAQPRPAAAPPVAVQPTPVQPAPVANVPPPAAVVVAKAELPKAAEVAREAVDPATACIRDEQRLARLRAEPSRDQIVNFQKDLSCDRLRSQVQRLLESMMPDPPQQASPATAAVPEPAKPQVQAQARPMSTEEVCARDAAQLMRLRAEPSAEAIARFDRELGCEHIRPQLQRLRESLGL